MLKALGMGVSACAQWSNMAKGSTNNSKEQHQTNALGEGAQSMEIITGWEICILMFSEAVTGDSTDACSLQSVPS